MLNYPGINRTLQSAFAKGALDKLTDLLPRKLHLEMLNTDFHDKILNISLQNVFEH